MGLFDKIFGWRESPGVQPSNQDTHSRIKVATCVILLEVAAADDVLSDTEVAKVGELLKLRFDLGEEEVKELMSLSREERSRAVDLWRFTNLVNEALTIEQKYEVAEMVWSVIYSDKTMDRFEDHMAHRLISLLNLEHAKCMDIKIKVKENLGIL